MRKAPITSFTRLILCPSKVSFSSQTHSSVRLYHQPLINSLHCSILFQNVCNFMAGWFNQKVFWMDQGQGNEWVSSAATSYFVKLQKNEKGPGMDSRLEDNSAAKKKKREADLGLTTEFPDSRVCEVFGVFLRRQGESPSCRLSSGSWSPPHPSDTHQVRSLHIITQWKYRDKTISFSLRWRHDRGAQEGRCKGVHGYWLSSLELHYEQTC